MFFRKDRAQREGRRAAEAMVEARAAAVRASGGEGSSESNLPKKHNDIKIT